MKKIHIYLFIIIISLLFINCTDLRYNHSNKEDNLYFVFSTFRHGARTPFVKKDIFKNEYEHRGLLTKYGEKQHLNIGKKNRKRYFNFLNLGNQTFDTKQLLVRSSSFKRVLISTQKQLKGLLNSEEYYNIIHPIKLTKTAFDLYNMNIYKNMDIISYYNNCNKLRKLNTGNKKSEYENIFYENILPIFEKCYGPAKFKSIFTFCDQVFSSYYVYTYEPTKVNKIAKCEHNIINKINNFCVKYFNSLKGWKENIAYYFYSFFVKLLELMDNSIKGISKLKMFMIGGHDSTVAPLMNFLNGLKIVKRTEYPHFAYNIIFELRKYNNEYYIEIYYNDILKYNKTMNEFRNTLEKSKYSKKNNFCNTYYPHKMNKNNEKTFDNKKFRIKFLNKVIIILILLIANGLIIFSLTKGKKVKKNISNISNNIDDISKTDIIHEVK